MAVATSTDQNESPGEEATREVKTQQNFGHDEGVCTCVDPPRGFELVSTSENILTNFTTRQVKF